MGNGSSRRLRVPLLLVLLTASLVGNVLLYPLATRPLFDEGDRPLVDRTVAAASHLPRSEFFPIVYRRHGEAGEPSLTCVELRSRHRLGHYGTCYDVNGHVVEERQSVVDGNPALRERVEQWFTAVIGWP